MDAFKEIEETQVALDQAYARLVAMRQSHDVGGLAEVHDRAEEALAGARALVQMLEELASDESGQLRLQRGGEPRHVP
jgi:hypothetical protein